MFEGLFEQDRTKMMKAYTEPHWDQESGLDAETLRKECDKICEKIDNAPQGVGEGESDLFYLKSCDIGHQPSRVVC